MTDHLRIGDALAATATGEDAVQNLGNGIQILWTIRDALDEAQLHPERAKSVREIAKDVAACERHLMVALTQLKTARRPLEYLPIADPYYEGPRLMPPEPATLVEEDGA